MTELKTLKDLNIYQYTNSTISRRYDAVSVVQLRQEAVKWVKHIEKLKKPQSRTGEPFNTCKWKREEFKTQILWIKYFFNITEEELK